MCRTIELGLCLVIAALAGCGKSATSISGEVTYNGTPVEYGYLTFSPVGSGRSIAAPIDKGRYSISEAVPGKFTAVAIGSRKIDHYSSSAEAYAHANDNPNAGHVSEATDYIAQDAAGNSRQVEIVAGEQTIDFAITGEPMPR